MKKKTKYLVMSNTPLTGSGWEEELQSSLGICHTCRRAYDIALFLAGITKPDLNYRKVLETLKRRAAVTVRQQGGEQAATVVKTRIY